MTDRTSMALGKREPKHDRRTLRLGNYLTAAAYPTSAHWDARIGAHDWGMMANDTVGCCTCTTAGHHLQAWTTSDRPNVEYRASDTQILQAYSAVTGYDPRDPSTDQGAYCLDVLNYWRRQGIAGRKIVAYMQVDPKNDAEVKTAIWAFGGLYLGVSLPVSAQTQTIWKAPRLWERFSSKWRPGSWGGHAVPLVAYDTKHLTCITWGQAQQMTYGFLHRYCDEAYVCLSEDWTGTDRLSPSGFDYAKLLEDLNAITGGA